MGLSMITLWGNYFSGKKSASVEQDADQPENPMTILAEGLHIPWDIAFLPTGELLVIELSGRLLLIGPPITSYQLPEVVSHSEAGLLSIALHPNFEHNHWIYLYLTTKRDEKLVNTVVRCRFHGYDLKKDRVILDNIRCSLS